jgi:large subunit ribosomal protein L14
MIQPHTIVQCIDNSGAKTIFCIQQFSQSKNKFQQKSNPSICLFKGVVRSLRSTGVCQLKQSDLVFGLLVRWKKKHANIKFSENACILVNAKMEPLAKRIFGPIAIPAQDPAFSQIMKLRKRKNIFDIRTPNKTTSAEGTVGGTESTFGNILL